MKSKFRKLLRDIKYGVLEKKYRLLGYKIKRGFVLGKRSYIEEIGFSAGINVYIGPYSYIGPNTVLGNYAMLSDHIHIIGSDHVFNTVGSPIILSGRPSEQLQTVIEDDVWIGHAVTIMRGVTIGEGSIVGANSLVTKDIPPYSIYGGIPAKFIKQRFSTDEEKKEHSKKIKLLVEESIA